MASEVRSLAQRSSQAAKDIKDLIVNSSAQVRDGVELVNRAGTSLREIVESIRRVADIVSDIATASVEQASGLDQINTALSHMDEATQQNSALVEQSAASAKMLEYEFEGDDRSRQLLPGRQRRSDEHDAGGTPVGRPNVAATADGRIARASAIAQARSSSCDPRRPRRGTDEGDWKGF